LYRAGITGAQSLPIHALAHRSGRISLATLQFSAVPRCVLEPVEAPSVCYRGTAAADKIPLRFDISLSAIGAI
jgi:hypothetical protein